MPDIHDVARGNAPGIHSHFAGRFDDRFNPIDIGIADDLQHRSPIFEFLQFDHRDVLVLRCRNNGLQDKDVHIPFIAVDHAYIVDVSIAIQVEVVNLGLGIVQHSLELLGRTRFLKKFESSLQAEVVARYLCLYHLRLPREPSGDHYGHRRKHCLDFHKTWVLYYTSRCKRRAKRLLSASNCLQI